MAGNPTFPSVLLPDKQTSKWESVRAAPLLPHTSCDSKSQGWAVREVPVHVRPKAGPLSQGNQGSQRINQASSKVPTAWLQASSSFLLSFISATH